jgi:hypothetical protein
MTPPNDLTGAAEIDLMKVDRVDAVHGPAHGLPFLLLKAADPDAQPDADELMADASDAGMDGAGGSETPSDAPGDPDDPASPAWEAVDAARARTAVNMVIALQRLVGTALSREAQEIVTSGDPSDDENAYDLSCVLDSLDCILETLAPFAVGEQAEALDRQTDAESVMTKSGRVLSGTNEQSIRQASTLLENVLASLPAATVPEGTDTMTKTLEPLTKTDDKATVADPDGSALGTDLISDTTAGETAGKPIATIDNSTTGMAKAAGDPMALVYDANGNPWGAVDPSKVTVFQSAAPANAEPTDDPADPASTDPATPPAEPAAVPADPADGATIPGTATVQAPVEQDMTKALTAETLADALKEVLTPMAKQLEQNTELAAMVKGLQEQVEVLGRKPDDRKSPILNGATGTPGVAARDGQTDQFADLKKNLADAPAAQRPDAQAALAFAQIRDRFTR